MEVEHMASWELLVFIIIIQRCLAPYKTCYQTPW